MESCCLGIGGFDVFNLVLELWWGCVEWEMVGGLWEWWLFFEFEFFLSCLFFGSSWLLVDVLLGWIYDFLVCGFFLLFWLVFVFIVLVLCWFGVDFFWKVFVFCVMFFSVVGVSYFNILKVIVLKMLVVNDWWFLFIGFFIILNLGCYFCFGFFIFFVIFSDLFFFFVFFVDGLLLYLFVCDDIGWELLSCGFGDVFVIWLVCNCCLGINRSELSVVGGVFGVCRLGYRLFLGLFWLVR